MTRKKCLPLLLGLLLGIPGCGARSALYLDEGSPTEATTTCPAIDDCVGGACKPKACAGTLGLPNPPLTFLPPKVDALAMGDFDGDGRADLAATTRIEDSLIVLLGQGNGVFVPGEVMAIGESRGSIAAADFDGDGKTDLAVDTSSNGVRVFLSNGDGTFAPAADYDIPGASIAAADLSGDGKPDIAIATDIGVLVLLNQGDGTFGLAAQYSSVAGLSDIAAADLNGDGKPDIVSTENAPAPGKADVLVLLNQGNGTLSSPFSYDINGGAASIVAMDLNGDGHPEIVVARDDDLGKVDVLLNQGSGTFAAAVDYDLRFFGVALAAADVNGDGHPDLAAAGDGDAPLGDDAVTVFLGRGDGAFELPVTYLGIYGPLATDDLNGDSWPDIVHVENGTLRVFLNEGGTLAAPTSYGPAFPWTFETTDLNGDGRPDIAVLRNANNDGVEEGISVFLNQGDGTFSDPINAVEGGEGRVLATADIDGDGGTDLVINEALWDAPGLRLYLNEGNASFAAPITIPTDEGPGGIAARDLNGDGKGDIAYTYCAEYADCGVRVLLNEGNNSFAPELDYPISVTLSVAMKQIEVVDLNGDCNPDLVLPVQWKGVHVLLNQGDGTFAAPTVYPDDTYDTAIAIGDLNGDERPDLTISPSWHPMRVLLNQGDGTFAPASHYREPSGPGSWIVAEADMNGDGRIDILRQSYGDMLVYFSVCLP